MDLRDAIIAGAEIAPNKPGNVPEMARIHVERGKLSAWDGVLSVEFHLDADHGSFAVDAAFAGKMAKRLETLSVEVGDVGVTFKEGDLTVRMHKHTVQAYPHPKGVSIGKIKAVDFGGLLETAASFCADGIPVTANVFILQGLMCATDTVVMCALPLPDVEGVALPRGAAVKLAKLLKKDKDGFLMLDIQHVDSPDPGERGYRFVCSEFSIFVISDAELRFPVPRDFFLKPVNYTITLPEMLAPLIQALPDNEPVRIESAIDVVTVEALNAKIVFTLEVLGAKESCKLDCLAGHIKLLFQAVGADVVLELTDSNTNVRCDGKYVLAPLEG